MKTICFMAALLAFCGPGTLLAQDAGTEERLNKLAGQIEDLIAAQRAQQKQIEALGKEIENLREHVSKPSGNYASQEDLTRLAEALKEIDRKRIEESERISSQLTRIGKSLTTSPPPPKKAPSPGAPETAEKGGKEEKGYSYVVQSGDTISVIVQAYRDKNIKVTTDQVLKANPGLKPEKLQVGQKIWIPAPQS